MADIQIVCLGYPQMLQGTKVQNKHTCEYNTHFVGLMSGLLPKRNDGRSSAIVPFRRRNFSVRSNPVNRITMCH